MLSILFWCVHPQVSLILLHDADFLPPRFTSSRDPRWPESEPSILFALRGSILDLFFLAKHKKSLILAPPTYHCTRAGGSSPARARFVFLFLRRTPRHKYVFCPSIHFYVYFVNQRVHFSQCARPRLTSCLANSYQEYLFAVIFALCFWRRGCSARQRGNALFHES